MNYVQGFDPESGRTRLISIAKLKLGAVVRDTILVKGQDKRECINRYGHIIGFARTVPSEVPLLLNIQFDDGHAALRDPKEVHILD